MYERILMGPEVLGPAGEPFDIYAWGIAKDGLMLYFQTLLAQGSIETRPIWCLPSETGEGHLGPVDEYEDILHREPLSDSSAAMAIFQIDADDETIIWTPEEMRGLLESLK